MAEVDNRIAAALEQIELAAGSLKHPDWATHSAALADAVAGLGRIYLHVDAVTGQFDAGPIWADPDRVVFGDLPATVAPLVAMLQSQTARIEAALKTGWTMPTTEAAAWSRWKSRLVHYAKVVAEEAEAGEYRKSPRLFEEVTGPLVSGVYPSGWEGYGIFAREGKPDATTPAATVFVVALQAELVSPTGRWVTTWGESVDVFVETLKTSITRAITSLAEHALDGAAEGVGTAAKWLFGGALLVGALVVGSKLIGRRQR